MSGVDFERTAELARRMKADVVKKQGWRKAEDAADLPSFVLTESDGHLRALIHPGPGVDGMRNAVFIAAAMFPCDAVWIVSDARMRTYAKEEWPEAEKLRQGELSDDWHAGRRDGISEVIIIWAQPRQGEGRFRAYPYRRIATNLRWGEAFDPDSIDGALLDHAQAGFAKHEELWPEFVKMTGLYAELLELPDAERDYHRDRAVARYVSGSDWASSVSLLDDGGMFIEGEEVEG